MQPVRGSTRVFLTGQSLIFLPLPGKPWCTTGVLFDWKSGKSEKGYINTEHPLCQAMAVTPRYNPDGMLAALGNASRSEILLWNTKDARLVRRLAPAARGAAPRVSWSPDGKAVAWSQLDGEDSARRTPLQYELDLTTLTLRPIAKGELKKYKSGLRLTREKLTVKVVKDQLLEITGGPEPVTHTPPAGRNIAPGSVTLLPDNRAVYADYQNTLYFLDTTTGKLLFQSAVTSSRLASPDLSPDDNISWSARTIKRWCSAAPGPARCCWPSTPRARTGLPGRRRVTTPRRRAAKN
jgi:hypothetical protein